jgi:hypothetical protein
MLVLKSQANNYLPTSQQVGVRLVVDEVGEATFPDNAGFTLSPGRSIEVLLEKEKVIRMNLPSGSCRNVKNDWENQIFNDTNYSIEVSLYEAGWPSWDTHPPQLSSNPQLTSSVNKYDIRFRCA